MMRGTLAYICIGEKKGQRKRPVERAMLHAGHGLEGDAHAGPWHRQLSLLDVSDVESMKSSGVEIVPGTFGENLGVSGIDLTRLGLGSRVRIGEGAELTISQIGKQCHAPCAIYAAAGDCIMPRAGLFARVTVSGAARPGDLIEVVEQVARSVFQVVILTISDRCSRGEAEDTAGPAVGRMLREKSRYHVYRGKVLPDEKDAIGESLLHYCDGHGIDLVLTVGGTGFSPRDVTPEATRAVVERLAPGLDEAMRAASLRQTPHAMLSRGVSGIRRSTLIVNLPGSEKGAVGNLATILPALPHALEKLRGSAADCDPARGGREGGS